MFQFSPDEDAAFLSRFRDMAILHQATLVPSKLELMTSWLPSRTWLHGADTSAFVAVGAYRFDDPDGEVGMESHLLKTAEGLTIQVPLTYRAAPLGDAEEFFVGTMEHSVLGQRWVYDGCGDVTYLTALVATILSGGHEAPLDVITDDGLVRREATTKVLGSGSSRTDARVVAPVTCMDRGTETHVNSGDLEIVLYRVVGDKSTDEHVSTLSGTWVGQEKPVTLASLLTM